MKEEEKKYSTGFTTPDHYFDDVEQRILNAVKQDPIPKNLGFTVPDEYFNDVEKILKQIPVAQNTTAPKVIPLYRSKTFIVAASVAACIALIVSLVHFSSETPLNLNDIKTETIASYIDDGNLELSAQEIALLLQDEDMNALGEPSAEISTENLTEYLLNHIDDPTFYLE